MRIIQKYRRSIMRHTSLIAAILVAMLATANSPLAQAEASDKLWPVVKEAFFANRPVEVAPFMQITGPKRAESGAQVPITISVDQTAASSAIKKVYVIIDANPIQLAATYHLTSQLGNFQMATRIRMETDSYVRAIGETADGKLYMAVIPIRAAGGCGGTVDGDEAEIRASAGKIKLNLEPAADMQQQTAATFIIKHPMRTGLQRDLVSQGYVPAFYINHAKFNYNGQTLMEVDFGVGTSEDPYLKFSFIPASPGTMEVTASDNEGKTFSHQMGLKS